MSEVINDDFQNTYKCTYFYVMYGKSKQNGLTSSGLCVKKFPNRHILRHRVLRVAVANVIRETR